MARIRRYSELSQIDSFEERFEYLSLRGTVGESTFGFERHINQSFYRSVEWRQLRHHVIARDLGCDMAFPEHEIHDRVIIHHMNPMTVDEIVQGEEQILNPDYLITVSHNTHNAIHYGDSNLLPKPLIERRPGDTRLW